MYGIVSLLQAEFERQVEALWNELEACCRLKGIRLTPLPHFSWQVAESYDIERLKDLMQGLSKEISPLSTRTSGLGLFTGESPVLYIPVVKDETLLKVHAHLWNELSPLGHEVNPHYGPDSWVPHITLAHSDVNQDKLTKAVETLASESLDWEMRVTNLALVQQEGLEVGTLECRFDLTG